MEEMADAGKDDHRQDLRPRPGERRRERHDVVALAVDDERVGAARGAPRCFSVDGPTSTSRAAWRPSARRCAASTAT